MVMGVLSRTILARELARNWALVYVGNLIGALAIVLLVFYGRWWEQGDLSFSEFSVTSADAKVNLSFGVASLRGIVANMLVCLGVWMATAGRTVTDKLLAVFLPVTAFVAGGFEHSVANMFFLPFGALVATDADALAAAGLTAADVSRLDMAGIAQNLVAVTLGNIVGGVLVGLADWTVHLRRRAVSAAAAVTGDSAPGTSFSSQDTPSQCNSPPTPPRVERTPSGLRSETSSMTPRPGPCSTKRSSEHSRRWLTSTPRCPPACSLTIQPSASSLSRTTSEGIPTLTVSQRTR